MPNDDNQEVNLNRNATQGEDEMEEIEVSILSPFVGIPFNDGQFFQDLMATYEKLREGRKDFIKREYQPFSNSNLTFATNTNFILGGMGTKDDVLKDMGVEEVSRIYQKRGSLDPFVKTVGYDIELLLEVGKQLKRYARRSRFEKFNYYDAMKTYSEKEFMDILLSYYATYGDKYYQIAKKYIEDHRISFGSKLINNSKAYFLQFNWLNSGYIFTSYNKLDGVTLGGVAHEIGHAVDSETFLFPQRKKHIIFSDTMVEFPSVAFEIGLYDYLKDQNIDYTGGLILGNMRAHCMIYHFTTNRKALLDPGLMIYQNGVAEDSKGVCYDFRTNLVYGLGYLFGFHLSEIRKRDPQEFLRVLNNINTQRFEIPLDEAIKMTGYDLMGFLDCRYIRPRITEDCMELKRRYRQQ